MSGESSSADFNRDRAELFEALGHPTRIKILGLLAESPMGFADLKKALGIDSSGLLQFHLGKLNTLVKTAAEGQYVPVHSIRGRLVGHCKVHTLGTGVRDDLRAAGAGVVKRWEGCHHYEKHYLRASLRSSAPPPRIIHQATYF